MRLQLKVPRGLTSGLTTAAASVRRSTVYRPPRPPDGPGCSRWISCSCCLRQDDTAFFSRNNDRPISSRSQITSSFGLKKKSSIFVETVAATDNLPRQAHTRPQLPLPPTLPYSPDSVPFQRHLQHLSLAVLSTDLNESWRTYTALHKSLRRYIPDDLFRSLLAHQLSNTHAKQSWVRGLALIKFARTCGVEAKDLGEENLRNALQAGFDLVLRTKVSDFRQYLPELSALWTQVKDTSREVPVELRRSWLRLHHKRTAKNKDERLDRARDALMEVIERYGTTGIEREAGKIVSLYDGTDPSLHIRSLRLAAWCADRGLTLSDDTFLVMLRLHQLWINQSEEPFVKLQSTVTNIDVSRAGTTFLHSVLSDIEHRYRSPAQRTAEAVVSQSPTPQLVRQTLNLLAADQPDLDAALDAIATLIRREADFTAVVSALLDHLDHCLSPEPLLRLTHLLLQADLLRSARADHLRHILRLLVSSLTSEDAYILSRKAYSVARQRGFRWTYSERDHWQKLFHHAVHRSRRHLHFASRLYADLQADGLKVHRNDHLAFIRSIGMSRSASRPILLERHLNDYVHTEPALSPNAFVLALVRGLTSSASAQDASLAFDLARQVLRERPTPLAAAELLIPRLITSANLAHLRRAVHLLDVCPTADAYNHVIFSIVAHSKVDAGAGQMSRTEALSQSVEMYKRMVERGISATPRTVSLLLRALVDDRHTEAAVRVFGAAAQNGIVLKPNAVGRLMVRLILDDKLDQAADLETQWRQVSSSSTQMGRTYDKAIVGARVLLDSKRGVEVDFDQIARQTGWTATAPFLRFLETLKPQPVVDTASRLTQAERSTASESSRHKAQTTALDQGNTPRPRQPWMRSETERKGPEADSMGPIRPSIVA